MKVRILQKFHDRVDYTKVYLVGETFTFDDARAAALIARGLVESAEESVKPEVELAMEVAEDPVKPVSKVQPIVKQAKKKASKAN